MKSTTAVILAAILCVLCAATVSAHEAALDKSLQLCQKEGPGHGIVRYSDVELKFWGESLKPRTWYTLVAFEGDRQVTCLGTRKSDCEGRVRICADYDGCVRHLKLVLTKDVNCFGDTGPVAGEMTAWHPDMYLFEGQCCD
jgi:hypothetical protein